MIYLDHAATTPVRREVLEAMWPCLTGEFGNPSSHHGPGERARDLLEQARARVAATLACRPAEIVFTSGGTEADNLAIKGVALAEQRGRHIVTSPIEHEAVLASCEYLRRHHGFTITHVPVDRYGMVERQAFQAALRPDTTLASVMLANNEVGTVQPIAALAALAHAAGVPFHTDAVQAGGALPVQVSALGVDAMSLSGHKFGAPKGVGMLYLRRRLPLEPVLHGGGQERGRRSGTENVAGAVGFACALALSEAERPALTARIQAMRDELIRGVLAGVPGAVLTGHPSERLPGSASFCFGGVSGEAMLLALEEQGIVCSSGSACAAGSDDPSHVLLAMGTPPVLAQTAVRFSFGPGTLAYPVGELIRAVVEAGARVRGIAVPAV